MAQQCSASEEVGGEPRNHSASFDHSPEIWTEILKLVPEGDRRVQSGKMLMILTLAELPFCFHTQPFSDKP